MKLVEILAKELSEWPKKASHAVQHINGDVGFTYDGKPGRMSNDWSINAKSASRKSYWLIGAATSVSKTASDHATAIVTRADWEKEKMKQATPKKNAEGWIRHNNKKQPVDDHVEVEIRTRGGDYEVCKAYGFAWDATGEYQIMAYRLHKPAEQVEACSKPELQINLPDGYGEIYNAQAIEHGPLQWRDRITELDEERKTIDALYQVNITRIETERADLVQKLASEGFALIGRVGDMSDSKKWMVGDLFTVNSGDDHSFDVGDRVVLTENDGTSRLLFTKDGEESWVDTDCVKFHSRPSA